MKCTNNAANTYLKCNRLKFTLNRARRALIQARRRTGNGSTVRTVEPLMRHAWIMEYSGKPKRPHPRQKLPTSGVEVFVILLNNATPQRGKRRRPAEHGWSRAGSLEGKKPGFFFGFFLSVCTGRGVKSTFVLPADTFHSIRKTSLPLTYSWIHNLQVADN